MTTLAAPKKVIAIIVMTAFIMVCVLAPFGAAHAIVGLSTAAVTILIAGLAAIGITFASTGGFDTLNDYVESLLQEYASDNNIPVTSIFNGTQYSSSAAGKLLLNNRFVTLIDTFAQWVIGKLNLTDNNSYTVLSQGTFIAGYPVFSLPYYIYRYVSPKHYTIEFVETVNSEDVYACNIYNDRQTSIDVYLISRASFTATKTVYSNGNLFSTSNYSSSYNSTYGWNIVYGTGSYSVDQIVDLNSNNCLTQAEFYAMLNSEPVVDVNNIGIGIDVGSISLPSDNLDFNSGDGAILDVGASWGETTGGAIATVPDIWPQWLPQTEALTANPDISIEYEAEAVLEESLPQPSDIENLPGSTIPDLSDIPSFEFHSLWHYVAQWISDMASGGAVLWNVCIQAPPAIVNLVFAGIVLAMWFGAIKILR